MSAKDNRSSRDVSYAAPPRWTAAGIMIVAIVVSVWAVIAILPTTSAFWSILQPRFETNSRNQLQNLFLPDRARTYPMVVVGDSLFQKTVAEALPQLADAEKLVINNYDSTDLEGALRGIVAGESLTASRICGLLVQVSPNFAVRARGQGEGLRSNLIYYYRLDTNLLRAAGHTFSVLKAWARTRWDGDPMTQGPMRVPAHVGQTRFADPEGDNWRRAFKPLKRLSGSVTGVLDIRGTDWGEGSDLVDATEKLIKRQARRSKKFTATTIDELGAFDPPECS